MNLHLSQANESIGRTRRPVARRMSRCRNLQGPARPRLPLTFMRSSAPLMMKHAKGELKASRPIPPHGLAYAHKSKPETPPPSRGRLGGGWGKKDMSEFNLLKMTHEFNPIPTLTLVCFAFKEYEKL